jgi:transposase-like protein
MARNEQISVMQLVDRIRTTGDAYAYMEQLRWPNGPVCPHCHETTRLYFLNPANGTSRKTRTGSMSQRRVWKCGACRKQFSVTTGTVFHGSKIDLRKWLFVIFEMCASKNGVSAREVERKYDLTPKSAWFMTQRIREAMKAGPLSEMMTGVVIADETYIGGRLPEMNKKRRKALNAQQPMVPGSRTAGPGWNKTSVLSLIDQDTGEVRSRVVPDVTGATLRKAIGEQCDLAATTLYTDEHKGYKTLAPELAGHESVNHKDEQYARYRNGEVITTNAAEGYFSQLKRSLDGTHHHVSVQHLPRYLAEFDFRYSTRQLDDSARMRRLMGQVGDRRLTYRPLTGR